MAGKVFQVWVPDPLVQREGKRVITKRFHSVEAGEDWRRDEKARLSHDALIAKQGRDIEQRIGPARKSLTLTAAKGFWLGESPARKATRDYYQLLWSAHLEPKLGDVQVVSITRSRVRQHLEQMADAKKSQETRRRVLRILRAILGDARDRGYQVDATVWKIKITKPPRKRSRVYDPALVKQLIDSAKGQDRVMLQVAAWTGMRLAELIGFEVGWIRWLEKRIAIPNDQKHQTKGDEERSAPLFAELEAVLKQHLGERTSGRVFRPVGHGSAGNAWTKDGMISAFERLATAAGVPFTGWHDLRHHYASDLAHRGASAPELMAVCGWSDLATAQKYLHASPDHLAGLRARLEVSSESSSARPREVKSGPRTKGPKPASNQ